MTATLHPTHKEFTSIHKDYWLGCRTMDTLVNLNQGYIMDTNDQLFITNREIEILKALSEGLIAREISEKLNISLHTVETHKKNVMRKSRAKTTTELVCIAIRTGIID